MIDRIFRKWTFLIAACILFVSASYADGISADKSNQIAVEVAEALSLSAGSKTELEVINATHGNFFKEEDVIVVLPEEGRYIDESTLAIRNSGMKAILNYRFGNNASTELAGKHIQFIAQIDSHGDIVWSCNATDQIVIEHFPKDCRGQAAKENLTAEKAERLELIEFSAMAMPRDEALRKQITEALSLAAGSRTELEVIKATHGNFFKEEDVIVALPEEGRYIDESTLAIRNAGMKAILDYRFGNNASTELVGKHLQIVGEIEEGIINWSCHATDQIVIDHFPEDCLSQTEKEALEAEEVERLALELAAMPRDEALRKQITEALSLAAEPKIELLVMHAEFGEFKEKYVRNILAGVGRYVDNGLVVFDSSQKATIDYRFGNAASDELIGKHLQIIGEIDEGIVNWSCHTTDQIVIDHFPEGCVSQAEKEALEAEEAEQLALDLVDIPRDEVLREQITEALLLSAGPKTELGVINAEFGEFKEKYVHSISAGIGKYIDHSSVASDSPKKAIIDYRFGNAASDELIGKHLQIIGEINSDGFISWSCRTTDQIVLDHFPSQCVPEVEENSDSQIKTTDDLLGLFFPVRKLRQQVGEAFSLAPGPKIELGVYYAERGSFEQRYEIDAGTGRYIDSSSVTYDDSGLEAIITYRYGNDADPEITGQKLLIIGTIREGLIEWTCRPADGSEKLNDYLPNACDPI